MKTKKLFILVIGLLAVTIINSCGINLNPSTVVGDTICLNYPNSTSELEVQLIHDMTENYKTKQLKTINTLLDPFKTELVKGEGEGDARAIKFDLETLKKFIYNVEMETRKRDPSISNKDIGIRIYYTSYPDEDYMKNNDELNNNVPLGFTKRHTLVMIPTIRIGEVDMDFNPLDERTFSVGLMGIGEGENREYGPNNIDDPDNPRTIMALPIIGNQTLNMSSFAPTSTAAQNHGSLYPPLGEGDLNF